MDETDKLFNDFDHRLKLIDKLSKDIDYQENNNNLNISRQKQQFEKELARLQKEFNEISQNTKELVKNVYHLGKILRDKITTRELNNVKAKVDSWKLEEFIHHNELESTFYKYHKE